VTPPLTSMPYRRPEHPPSEAPATPGGITLSTATSVVVRGSAVGRAWRRASVASFLLIVPCVMSCLPPDFVVEPDLNEPVRIDKRLLVVPPDSFHRLSGCPPPSIELDVGPGLANPDGDRLYSAWLVNHIPGQGGRPDATSTTGPRPFVFNPCTNPKVLTGASINTIELVVHDRAPASFDSGDEVKTIVDPDTTTDNIVWFIGVEDLSCCGGP
jgi:hypothetical protein